jgi:hypothetical protein
MTNYEILEFYNSANKCTDLNSLNEFYNKIGHLNHPSVFHKLGVKYLIFGDKLNAKKLLVKGAKFGLNYPVEYFDKSDIDSIGQCFTLLVTQFYLLNDDKDTINPTSFYKSTCLAYIYLSRAIELNENLAYDSLRSRAILFKDNNGMNVVINVLFDILNRDVLKEPFIVSDFYFAATIENNPNKINDMKSAKNMHNWLEDISIAGKDADEYQLDELSRIGKSRHSQLYTLMKSKFFNGDFFMENIEVG